MDGIVTALKPPGMTSSNVVYDVRRIFNEKRAGHLGTLDPGAAGVLPICLGRATRLFDYLVDKEKEYVCELALGLATDTQDAYGRIIGRDDRIVTLAEVMEVLPSFMGVQQQQAPIYSALKVDGQKMYDLARAGKPVEQKSREITIHSLELLKQTGENRFLLSIRCSRGTYVRTICADIGARLGTYGYMSFLLRAASGPFGLDHAFTIAEMEECRANGSLESCVISCEDALSFLPALELPEYRRTPAMNGLETAVKGVADGSVRLYCNGFLGIGTVSDGSVKLTVHLY